MTSNRILRPRPSLTRKQLAVGLKIAGALLVHSNSAIHIEDYSPVLYTEKRSARAGDKQNQFAAMYRYMQYPLHAARHGWHCLHQAWQRCLMQFQYSV